jgi:elongation factor 2
MQGTVCFSAALGHWAFSIPQFAKIYASKTSTPKEKWLDRLWGDHFLNSKSGQWHRSKSQDNQRGFVKFIYDPIYNIVQAAMNDQRDKLFSMCDKVGCLSKLLANDTKFYMGKKLVKRVMQARPLLLPESCRCSDRPP